MIITDRREQNLWFAFISAFFGAMSATLYYIIHYLVLSGTPNTDAERAAFSAITTSASLSLLISFLIFVSFWLLIRPSWQKKPHKEDAQQEVMTATLQKDHASPKLPAQSKATPHKKFLALAIFIMALIATTTVIYANEIWAADAYARYSFAVSSLITLLVAVLLGLYFWRLQKQDNVQTQSILDNVNRVLADQARIISRVDEVVRITAEMAAQENARQERRKQAWLKIANERMTAIVAGFATLRGHYQALSEGKVTQKQLEEMRDWGSHMSALSEQYYVPHLNDALAKIIDLFEDAELYSDITKYNRLYVDAFKSLPSADIAGLRKQDMVNEFTSASANFNLLNNLKDRLQKEF